MAIAVIINGRWSRNVPWRLNGVWRTDIFKTTLARPDLQIAEFHLKGGPRVEVPASELRRVLQGGNHHFDGRIWGPFNIDPAAHTINGESVRMRIMSGMRAAPEMLIPFGSASES